jgi:hypothetical protein
MQEARDKLASAIAEIDHEKERLLRALQSLDTRSPSGGPRKLRARRSRRRRARRVRKGERRDQFLAAVGEQPGITVAQAAKKIGVPPSQLYPVARSLRKEKAITKRGAGYTIKAQTQAKSKKSERVS